MQPDVGVHLQRQPRQSGAGDHPFPILDPPDPFNGEEYGGAAGYAETLSGTYDLPPCDGHPGCSTQLTRSGDFGVLLIGATGDQIGVEMDVGPISTDCVYLSEILGDGRVRPKPDRRRDDHVPLRSTTTRCTATAR